MVTIQTGQCIKLTYGLAGRVNSSIRSPLLGLNPFQVDKVCYPIRILLSGVI